VLRAVISEVALSGGIELKKDDLKRLKTSFSRAILLDYAGSKGLKYENITNRHPTRDEVLEKLKEKDADSHDKLLKILDLRRGVREQLLVEKAKELGVYKEGLRRLALATRIYVKNPQVLEDLYKFQRAEPKRSTFGFFSKRSLTEDRLKRAVGNFPQLIEEKLSEPDKDAIATVDSLSRVGGELRFVVTVDREKMTVERPKSPKFPGRKGRHPDYPMKRIRGTYNESSKVLRVSAIKDVAQKVVECFSEAAFDAPDVFEKESANLGRAPLIFSKGALRNELEARNIRVTELELREVPLAGSPSKIAMQGDDLVKTMAQLEEAGIPLLGENLSRVVAISLSFDGKRIEIDLSKGKQGHVGNMTDQEKEELDEFLKRWGIFAKT